MPSSHVIAVGGPPTFRPQIARALRTDPELIDWVQTASAAEAAAEQSTTAYQLLVLSPLVDEAEAAALARALAKRSPTTAVVVVRDRPLDGAMPRLVRAGVRDVVDLSTGPEELQDALSHALAWSESVRQVGGQNGNGHAARGRVVSVFSRRRHGQDVHRDEPGRGARRSCRSRRRRPRSGCRPRRRVRILRERAEALAGGGLRRGGSGCATGRDGRARHAARQARDRLRQPARPRRHGDHARGDRRAGPDAPVRVRLHGRRRHMRLHGPRDPSPGALGRRAVRDRS